MVQGVVYICSCRFASHVLRPLRRIIKTKYNDAPCCAAGPNGVVPFRWEQIVSRILEARTRIGPCSHTHIHAPMLYTNYTFSRLLLHTMWRAAIVVVFNANLVKYSCLLSWCTRKEGRRGEFIKMGFLFVFIWLRFFLFVNNTAEHGKSLCILHIEGICCSDALRMRSNEFNKSAASNELTTIQTKSTAILF